MDASLPHSPTSLRAPKTRKGVWRLQGMGQRLSHGRACGTVGQGLGLSLLFFAGFLALATARDGHVGNCVSPQRHHTGLRSGAFTFSYAIRLRGGAQDAGDRSDGHAGNEGSDAAVSLREDLDFTSSQTEGRGGALAAAAAAISGTERLQARSGGASAGSYRSGYAGGGGSSGFAGRWAAGMRGGEAPGGMAAGAGSDGRGGSRRQGRDDDSAFGMRSDAPIRHETRFGALDAEKARLLEEAMATS